MAAPAPREVKLAIFFTQDRLDKDGCPVRDRDSASVIATFVPAAVFAGLVKAEGIRRGADHVRQLGAVPVTAEAAVLNFTSTTQLDPSDYTNPEQLLNNVGTAFLTTLPGWLSGWFCCSPCICFPRRTNRRHNGDGAYRLARPKPEETPQATVNPATVEVEATTENEAIRIGLVALNLTTSDDVVIKILQTPRNSLPGTDTPARVRLTRRPEHGS